MFRRSQSARKALIFKYWTRTLNAKLLWKLNFFFKLWWLYIKTYTPRSGSSHQYRSIMFCFRSTFRETFSHGCRKWLDYSKIKTGRCVWFLFHKMKNTRTHWNHVGFKWLKGVDRKKNVIFVPLSFSHLWLFPPLLPHLSFIPYWFIDAFTFVRLVVNSTLNTIFRVNERLSINVHAVQVAKVFKSRQLTV